MGGTPRLVSQDTGTRDFSDKPLTKRLVQLRVQRGELPREAEDITDDVQDDGPLDDEEIVPVVKEGYSRIFSGAPRPAIHLARTIEFDIDPLALQANDEFVTCAECSRRIPLKGWRTHCRMNHDRSE